MVTVSERITQPSLWADRLQKLRWLLRGYILLQGIAAVLALLAILFWISLFVDWAMEPAVSSRILLLAIFCVLAVAVVFHVSASRLLVPLSDRSMALLLERQYHGLGDRLVTVVELASKNKQELDCDPRMLASTRDEVDRMMPQTDIRVVFNLKPLLRNFLVAGFLLATVAGFLIGQPEVARIWAQRSLLLGNVAWPHATKIDVEGFAPDPQGRRAVKVARGGSLAVRAMADMNWAIPDAVEICYQADAGVLNRPNMTRLNRAVPGRDPHQFYEYQFTNIQSSMPFSVTAKGGGFFAKHDRVEDLLIEAVESPDLTEIGLEYEYPKYLGRKSETTQVRLLKPAPEGTRIRVLARSSKPLQAASFRTLVQGMESRWEPIEIEANDPRQIELDLGALRDDARVAFQLVDTDGVANQQSIQLLVRITPDEKPEVEVDLVGIGKAITPVAALPIRGKVRDDHGISKSWFEFSIEGSPPQRQEFVLPEEGQLGALENLVFELAEGELQPGQKLSLQIKAADNCLLDPNSQIGESSRFGLRVVTEGELRALLETRERVLRRRFEAILAELRRTEDSLQRMRTDDEEAPAVQPSPQGPPNEKRKAPEDDTEKDRLNSPSTNRTVSVRLLRIETAIQISERMQHETASVAEEFQRILIELKNNKVTFVEELEQRIGHGIVTPLNQIAAQQFPQFQRDLRQLREVVDNVPLLSREIATTQQQLARILRGLEAVLKNMLDLQKFNELLADLRKIIAAQKQVSRETGEQRQLLEKQLKEQLKNALREE